jgi:hypothetical protein
MISLTLYGGGAFYVTPDSIDYVRELSPLEHEQGYPPATCAIGIGGKEFFVRGLAQNVAAEIQDENKTTQAEAQPPHGADVAMHPDEPSRAPAASASGGAATAGRADAAKSPGRSRRGRS